MWLPPKPLTTIQPPKSGCYAATVNGGKRRLREAVQLEGGLMSKRGGKKDAR